MTVYMQGKVIYIAQEEKWAQNVTLRHTWGHMHPRRALPSTTILWVLSWRNWVIQLWKPPLCQGVLALPAGDDEGRCRRPWKIATSTCSPASSDDKKWLVVSRSYVSHESPDLKPCWNLVRILCRSKWFKMCFTIICSRILHEIKVKETGL